MYIREGVPDVHQGGGYPMYTFFSKPGLESEYPRLSGPGPQCTPECWGTLQADDLGNFGLGKGYFGPFYPFSAKFVQFVHIVGVFHQSAIKAAGCTAKGEQNETVHAFSVNMLQNGLQMPHNWLHINACKMRVSG